MEYPLKRAVYRVSYPAPARPSLVVDGAAREVLDCSEHGLRFRAPASTLPPVGADVEGQLVFRRRPAVPIRGTVLRHQGDSAAVRFTDLRIPGSVIFEEQRYLRTHFPMWE